ncbi:PIN domain-containing protein [Thiomonas sp.]
MPVITLYEVFKRIAAQRDENDAIACVAVMQRARTVAIDDSLALFAAQLGLRHKLPLADSLIYATARLAKADLWTMDVDFQGLPGVHYILSRKRRAAPSFLDPHGGRVGEPTLGALECSI